jgi:hypothetical protein
VSVREKIREEREGGEGGRRGREGFESERENKPGGREREKRRTEALYRLLRLG